VKERAACVLDRLAFIAFEVILQLTRYISYILTYLLQATIVVPQVQNALNFHNERAEQLCSDSNEFVMDDTWLYCTAVVRYRLQ